MKLQNANTKLAYAFVFIKNGLIADKLIALWINPAVVYVAQPSTSSYNVQLNLFVITCFC